MPLINVFTSASPLPPDRADALLRELSGTLASLLGKPESYVVTSLVYANRMTFGGSGAPACYAEIKNVGDLRPDKTAELSRAVSSQLSTGFAIPPTRIYLELASVPPHLWGWNGETFA